MTKSITNTASFRLIDCETLEITYFDDVFLECDDVMENMWVIDQLTQGRKMKYLVNVGEFTQFSFGAKNLQIEEHKKRSNKIEAEAIIVRSLSTRMIENFYANKNKSLYNIRIFDNRVNAKKWLNEITVVKKALTLNCTIQKRV